ncbi:MAG: ferredoxin reductase [Actinomycetota bacterium]|nr:ferredoxin reductase [Actinomycetota bacterium]
MASRPASTAWQTATVVGIRDETVNAKTFRLRLSQAPTYMAGQHYVIRLTAPDGYTASRSYSIASAPDGGAELDFSVERLEGGEVSAFLHDVVEPGDELEVRGPIGRWFVWDAAVPALLIGGGSGVVPLMAMLRHARRRGRSDLVRLVVSVRTPEDLYYASELPGPEATVIYTRDAPPGSARPPGRLVAADLTDAPWRATTAFVCGSTGFADAATDLLIGSGMPAADIRVERFGPT